MAYALKGLLWAAATLVSLGLVYPLMRTYLQRHRTENTWFGDERFEFEGRAAPMFGRWLIAWILIIPTLGLSYIWYRVQEFRYFAASTRYAGLSFQSHLNSLRIFWIGIRYTLVLLALLAIIALAVEYIVPGLFSAFGSLSSGDDASTTSLGAGFMVGFFGFIIALSLVSGIARIVLLLHPMLREISQSLAIHGEEDFDAIQQSQQVRPRRGEGFADALDVGSF